MQLRQAQPAQQSDRATVVPTPLYRKDPNLSTTGRTAFYSITDVYQLLGISDQKFDAIVLHTKYNPVSGNEFEKYAVFNDVRRSPGDQETLPRNVNATFIYYDRIKGSFWSDGAYHKYLFSPASAMSVENAHIANEKFDFYIISADAEREIQDGQEDADCSEDPFCHSETDSD
jgi:hypothetical protein